MPVSTLAHRAITYLSGHIVHSLEVNDATELDNASLAADDVGRLAKQLDTGAFWLLLSVSPNVWAHVGPQPVLSYADEATRVAAVLTAREVGSIAHQVDTDEFWLLTGAPNTWRLLAPKADYRVSAGLEALTGAANTLAMTALGKQITVTHTAYSVLTVPPSSSVKLPVGCLLRGRQGGAGRVVVQAGAGVTIDAGGWAKITARQGAAFFLLQTALDTWQMWGDLDLLPAGMRTTQTSLGVFGSLPTGATSGISLSATGGWIAVAAITKTQSVSKTRALVTRTSGGAGCYSFNIAGLNATVQFTVFNNVPVGYASPAHTVAAGELGKIQVFVGVFDQPNLVVDLWAGRTKKTPSTTYAGAFTPIATRGMVMAQRDNVANPADENLVLAIMGGDAFVPTTGEIQQLYDDFKVLGEFQDIPNKTTGRWDIRRGMPSLGLTLPVALQNQAYSPGSNLSLATVHQDNLRWTQGSSADALLERDLTNAYAW